jgi:elongation factor G
MQKHATETVRNVGLFGHQGSGKTSLAEGLLFTSGAIDRLGRTDDGTATTDFDPEEIRRHISINIGLAQCEWHNCKVNLVDVPGYLDFQAEILSALRVVDIAVLVTPAQGSIEVGFEIAWDAAAAQNKPRAVFINKMDRENADYFSVVDKLRDMYGRTIAPVLIPLGQGENFQGIIDLVHMRAVTGVGREFNVQPIPPDMQETADRYRALLVESAAEGDDELLEKFLETETLTEEEVVRGLHEGIDAGKVVPVVCGSAIKDMGPASLLNLIEEAFPHPEEMGDAVGTTPDGKPASRKPSSSEPLCAQVFKTIADPFVGQLTYFRVYSGTIKADSHVWNSNLGKDERIGQLFSVRGKHQDPISELTAGDIGAVAKLAHTRTGDTLCDQTHPIILPPVEFPEPIYEIAIHAKTKVDEDKLGTALHRVAAEDPTFHYRRDNETAQTVLSGMGDTHLAIVLEKLKKYGANVDVLPIRVPYRETINGRAEGQGKHKKQSGGRGQYGDCWIRMEPLPRGGGFEFIDAIVGGSIPRNYLPAIEKGILEAMANGIQAGYPVVDIRCTCYEGSYHDVDSSEAAFKMAGILAFHNVAAKAAPVILEPILHVEVTVPEDILGDVMSDLSTKRGRIAGTESLGNGKMRITAQVPKSEMLRYAIDLRSIAHGRGVFRAEMSHYEEAPAHIAQQLAQEHQKHREEHNSHG